VIVKKNTAGVFVMKVVIRSKGGPIDVMPPNLGTGGFITLQLGHGDRYCVSYVNGTVVHDGDHLFKVRRGTTLACPGP